MTDSPNRSDDDLEAAAALAEQNVLTALVAVRVCSCCRRWAVRCPGCGAIHYGDLEPGQTLPAGCWFECEDCDTAVQVVIAGASPAPRPSASGLPVVVTGGGINSVHHLEIRHHLERCLQPAAPARRSQPDRDDRALNRWRRAGRSVLRWLRRSLLRGRGTTSPRGAAAGQGVIR